MTTHDALPPAVLQRKAVVYVRQSTAQQVQTNLESQRRQYELVDVARRRGFSEVEVIDDDLGRSASGTAERPGFERLVAALCAGKIGAVLCLDASRLARNGRDWHMSARQRFGKKNHIRFNIPVLDRKKTCLLYTSDAADE